MSSLLKLRQASSPSGQESSSQKWSVIMRAVSIFWKKLLLPSLFIIFMLCLIGVGSLKAQEGTQSDARRPLGPEDASGPLLDALPYHSPKEPVNCEVAGVYMDDVVRRMKNNTDGSYLIVIARLGNGETSQHLSRVRLKAVQMYMQYHPDVKLILAEGERRRGQGSVEFYVAGKLLYMLPIRKNSRLDLFSCIGI